MQCSSDSAVKFINKADGIANDRHWNRVSCTDGKDILSVYCTDDAYNKLSNCNFGQDISLVFDVSSGRNGTYITCIDIMVFNG